MALASPSQHPWALVVLCCRWIAARVVFFAPCFTTDSLLVVLLTRTFDISGFINYKNEQLHTALIMLPDLFTNAKPITNPPTKSFSGDSGNENRLVQSEVAILRVTVLDQSQHCLSTEGVSSGWMSECAGFCG